MGKRELLLVLVFAVAGTGIYQLTARPAAQGEQRFSVSALVDHVRRGVRGNRANAELDTTMAYPLSAAATEIRIDVTRTQSLTITGEDRADVSSELHVWSSGYDETEARRLAGATVLKAGEAGGRLTFTMSYPEPAQQRADLKLRVPAKMRVSITRYSGKLSISKTGDTELIDVRGDATIRDVTGRLAVTQRGGDLNIADVDTLKLNVRGSDVRLARVHGDVTVQAQGGEFRASELAGNVDIESNNTEVTLDRLETTRAPIHVTATNGSVQIRGVRSETRIDARNAEVTVSQSQAAVLAVYTEGGEQTEITPAAGGFQLDAVASAGGAITVPEKLVEIKVDGTEQRAAGAVNGGGPLMTLRSTHGEIVLRSPGSVLTPEAPPPPAPPHPPLPPKLIRR